MNNNVDSLPGILSELIGHSTAFFAGEANGADPHVALFLLILCA